MADVTAFQEAVLAPAVLVLAVSIGSNGTPDPPPKRLRLMPRRPEGKDIIVLAPFDGVGAPTIQQLFGMPRLSVSWKIDRACRKVMDARTSWVVQRGDITKEDAQSVKDLIHNTDPDGNAMIVWAAAPPCQDFSRITEGLDHQERKGEPLPQDRHAHAGRQTTHFPEKVRLPV